MYDYHTHSHFSSDCNVEMQQMIEAAIHKGLVEIAFTDHIDIDYTGTDISFDFDIPSQQATIEAFRETYKNRIRILKGIELGIQPHVLDTCSQIVQKSQPDFVIASMHVSNRLDLYNGDFFRDRTPLEAITFFFNELHEMTDSYRDYSVIGHLDILKRYHKDVRNLPAELFKQLAEPALKSIIRSNRGIEINTSGLRQGLDETLPSYEIAELYYELGGRILTIGSDAHRPDEIGHSFQQVKKVLSRIGFTELWTFDRMVPKPIDLINNR